MKAILHTRYGPPEELQLGEVETPVPGDHQVLIKIHATTVTSSDCNMRNATFVTGLMRPPVRLFMLGALRPKLKVLGIDLAGEVELPEGECGHDRKEDGLQPLGQEPRVVDLLLLERGFRPRGGRAGSDTLHPDSCGDGGVRRRGRRR